MHRVCVWCVTAVSTCGSRKTHACGVLALLASILRTEMYRNERLKHKDYSLVSVERLLLTPSTPSHELALF